MILETYPFLQDPVINEDSKPWGSLETKIFNRFKKLQRKNSAGGRRSNPADSTKGSKKQMKDCCWTMLPEQVETEDVLDLCTARIKKEWKKSKKNHDELKRLMARTYEKRRSMVLKEVQPIVNIISVFPPLQNLLYIKADFGKVMGNDALPTQMISNFNGIWVERLLAYAKKQEPKYENIEKEMEEAIDLGNLEEAECKGRAAVRLAEQMFKPANRKGCAQRTHEVVIKVATVSLIYLIIIKIKQI